jgi:hypothetical protein
MAKAEDGLDLRRGVREKHSARHFVEVGKRVAFVRVEFVGRSDEVAGTDDLAEFGEEGRVHVCWKQNTTMGKG